MTSPDEVNMPETQGYFKPMLEDSLIVQQPQPPGRVKPSVRNSSETDVVIREWYPGLPGFTRPISDPPDPKGNTRVSYI